MWVRRRGNEYFHRGCRENKGTLQREIKCWELEDRELRGGKAEVAIPWGCLQEMK